MYRLSFEAVQYHPLKTMLRLNLLETGKKQFFQNQVWDKFLVTLASKNLSKTKFIYKQNQGFLMNY